MEEREKVEKCMDEMRGVIKLLANTIKKKIDVEVSEKVSMEEYRKTLQDIVKITYQTANIMLNVDSPFFDKKVVFEFARLVGQTEMLIYLISK